MITRLLILHLMYVLYNNRKRRRSMTCIGTFPKSLRGDWARVLSLWSNTHVPYGIQRRYIVIILYNIESDQYPPICNESNPGVAYLMDVVSTWKDPDCQVGISIDCNLAVMRRSTCTCGTRHTAQILFIHYLRIYLRTEKALLFILIHSLHYRNYLCELFEEKICISSVVVGVIFLDMRIQQ